ncbi:hypothetical protein BU24DRAFT_415902 [Aaosphaeria arxii CBS 175.79]|uniref:Hydantoinase B/oxoprolinase domain-containing protein n=1 Tax=Aaosphaeria arxii CBS 175.79 TaxID=1450172 RepID=A0A6A5X6L0_9PLEO|nr:uncharacterized protein BU24DRAFT_415902 [Aaosphaeria arxii CBS 175.79]KAF2008550.1 hypothetical protein BU24DRAFT_415902 [Aaosphaeria arxii CBS 175.79]
MAAITGPMYSSCTGVLPALYRISFAEYGSLYEHTVMIWEEDPEILEKKMPILLRKFGIRHGSGGVGKYNGGDGAVRLFETRSEMTFIEDNERRSNRPFGMAGGTSGKAGLNLAILNHQSGTKRIVNVGPRAVLQLKAGEQVEIQTPGGGVWGTPQSREDAVDSAGIGFG